MKVYIWPDEMQKCRDFAKESAKTQQAVEFGATEYRRPVEEIERDTLLGKIGEVATVQYLADMYGIEAPLDFTVYPRGQWDGNDLTINGREIDVKATRPGAKYFLLENNKVIFRWKEGRIPYAFILAIVGWDRETDTPTGAAEIAGYIMAHDLRYMPRLKRGETIPGTRTTLQADNIYIPIDGMDKDFGDLIARLLNNRGVA